MNYVQDFPGGAVVKNLPTNAENMGSIPKSGRSPGEGNGKPTPVFLPGKFHNRRVWRATVHGVTESHTPLSTHRQLSFTVLPNHDGLQSNVL